MAVKKKDFSSAFGLDVKSENENVETKEENQQAETISENKENTKQEEKVEIEQVPTQNITIIQKNVDVQDRQLNEIEQYFLEELKDIREKINNPSPINRLNKRRQYDADKRRNVTFTLREDLSYLIDDLCDSAKVYKG